VEACDRDDVAGFGNRVSTLRKKLWIGLRQKFPRLGLRLHGRPVVNEMPDWNALGEFSHPTKMISVPMRGDQMVDLGKVGILGCDSNALGIPDRFLRAYPPCIDEQRFAQRRDEQCRVATLDVDDVDVQGCTRLCRGCTYMNGECCNSRCCRDQHS